MLVSKPQFRAAVAMGIGLIVVAVAGCSSTPVTPLHREPAFSFWPAAPDEPRIQFLTSFNSSIDIAPKKEGLQRWLYGAEPEATHGITKPYGVRMWNGRIYICDVRDRGVTVLDLRENQTRIMGATGMGTVRKAVDLAIAPDGTKYVVDQIQQAIVVFSPDERFVSLFPLRDCQLNGIAVHGEYLYVTDFTNAHVKVLDRASGRVLRAIGERGGEDGQFIGPLGVTTDAEGNLFVSDAIRACVQKFSPDGKFLFGFGQAGNRPGNFIRPKYMGIGSDGHIHIVDAAFNNVQVFDPEGRFVGFYGSAGRYPGAMDLPAGLTIHESDLDLFEKYVHPAFAAERLILVANQFGDHRIAVYAMGHLRGGRTVADVTPRRGPVDSGTAPAIDPTTQVDPASAAGASDAAR